MVGSPGVLRLLPHSKYRIEGVCNDDDDDDGGGGGGGDPLLGDFGFSGSGAAGFELDRVDPKLDPEAHNITILAQSHDKGRKFILVPEDMLTHLTNLSGAPEDEIRRADMVYFETQAGTEGVFRRIDLFLQFAAVEQLR